MSTVPVEAEQDLAIGPESAGVRMTPEEFDAIEDYDENYRYELVNGVLVVNPIPLAEETGPNELLGHWLLIYKTSHPNGKALDHTLPQQYVRTSTGRRIADRLIWAGLGRQPNVRKDVATIAVEFVSAGRRSKQRDYVDKRPEYMETGIAQYWIIDRFQRTMTVIDNLPTGSREQVVAEKEIYRPLLLPGFEIPVALLLEAADEWAQEE
jgi:Uma2 family endonuclease